MFLTTLLISTPTVLMRNTNKRKKLQPTKLIQNSHARGRGETFNRVSIPQVLLLGFGIFAIFAVSLAFYSSFLKVNVDILGFE